MTVHLFLCLSFFSGKIRIRRKKMKRFVKQVAVITGGAQGLGKGIASRLGREGASIAIVDAHKERLQATTQELQHKGIDVIALNNDITDEEAVKQSIQKVISKWEKIDILVNAAGITGKTALSTHEVDTEDFDLVMNVNVRGTFLYCKHAIPHMQSRKYGRILNIASISGKEGNKGMLAYSTSKAAVIGMTKVIGKDYALEGITCNSIAPAVVWTEMVAKLPPQQVKYMTDKIPMARTGTIEEISALAAYIVSEEAGFSTGFTFDCSGGRAVY